MRSRRAGEILTASRVAHQRMQRTGERVDAFGGEQGAVDAVSDEVSQVRHVWRHDRGSRRHVFRDLHGRRVERRARTDGHVERRHIGGNLIVRHASGHDHALAHTGIHRDPLDLRPTRSVSDNQQIAWRGGGTLCQECQGPNQHVNAVPWTENAGEPDDDGFRRDVVAPADLEARLFVGFEHRWIRAVRHDDDPICGHPLVHKVLFQGRGHCDDEVGPRTDLALRSLRESLQCQSFVDGSLVRERRVDFQHNRQARPSCRQHPGIVEQRVTLVDEVGAPAGNRPDQRSTAHEAVAELHGFVCDIRNRAAQPCQHARPRRRDIGGPADQRRDLHGVIEIAERLDHCGHVNALGPVPQRAVVIEDLHASASASRWRGWAIRPASSWMHSAATRSHVRLLPTLEM